MAKAPEILVKFDIHLLSPVELISRLDSIEREQEYQPLRLGASSIVTKRLEPQEISRFSESFRRHSHEKISAFKNLIDTCLLDHKTSSIHVAHDGNADMAASIAIDRQSSHRIHIRLLRLNSLPLAKTVLRQLLMKAIADAVESDAQAIHIGEPHLTRDVTDALEEMGFGLSTDGWIKPVVKGFHDLPSALQHLESVGLGWEETASRTAIDQLGTLIWPGKLAAEQITSHLIPIQARWAEHLFDADLARQRFPSFSGINDELHLGVEAVYTRRHHELGFSPVHGAPRSVGILPAVHGESMGGADSRHMGISWADAGKDAHTPWTSPLTHGFHALYIACPNS